MPSLALNSYAAKGKVKKIKRLKPTTAKKFTLVKGDRTKFSVKSTPNKNISKKELRKVFTSSNKKVAKVSKKGSVIPIAKGTTTIKCRNIKSGATTSWTLKVVEVKDGVYMTINMEEATKTFKNINIKYDATAVVSGFKTEAEGYTDATDATITEITTTTGKTPITVPGVFVIDQFGKAIKSGTTITDYGEVLDEKGQEPYFGAILTTTENGQVQIAFTENDIDAGEYTVDYGDVLYTIIVS